MIRLLPPMLPLVVICALNQPAGGQERKPPPKAEAKKEKPNYVALYRFLDKKLHEHVYTYGEGEPANWRLNRDMTDETVIGYASTTEAPGTRRLWRAIRPDGRHYFYTQAPENATDIRLEEFVIYVWAKKGKGRVALHGCSMPDGTDMYFDQDLKKVRKRIEETWTGTGVKRIPYANAFFLYEAEPKGDPDKGKEPAKAKR